MATTTTNFGWDIPQSTDLVKDGATAIAALGQDIDTALVDLKGGTTGQVLSKASNTDLDFTWVASTTGDITGVTAGTGISGGGTSGDVTITNSMATAIDAKGDLVVGTGADAFSRLAVGTDNQVLTADSSTATGLKWASSTASFVGASIYDSNATQSISNNTYTTITFNSEFFDTDSYHSTSTNTGRITIPSGKAGKYLFTYYVTFDTNGTGSRRATLLKNGTDYITFFGTGAFSSFRTVASQAVICNLAVGDYVELQVYQNSGGSLNVVKNDAPNATQVDVQYLGA